MKAVRMLLVLTLLTGLAYPLAITGLAQLLFPRRANGSLITEGGRVAGSELIGQAFDDPRYFAGRLSATPGFPYNGKASAGSNLGPLSPALKEAMERRRAALRAWDPENREPVPLELLTASGSGLDPHLSPAAAEWQAGRVARARGMGREAVEELIRRYTSGPQLGFLGEPVVNVLLLNRALDRR